MALRVHPFPADSASVVSGWAQTNEEVLMWCGLPAAPVPTGQINAWADENRVHPFGLYRDGRLVACGELWVDDDEAGVELAGNVLARGVVSGAVSAAWNISVLRRFGTLPPFHPVLIDPAVVSPDRAS